MHPDTTKDARPGGNIVNEQVILAFEQLPMMQATSFLVALVLAFAVRDFVPRGNILIWLAMVLGVVISRIVLYFRFRRVRDRGFAGIRWKNAFLALSLVSGLFWGLSAFLIFPVADPGLIALFVLVIASLAAATTISHSSLKAGAAAWSLPAMLLYSVRCFMEGGEFECTIGFLIVLYLFTIIAHSQKHHRAISTAISLKFQNLHLVDELRRANEILIQASSRDGLTGLANRVHFDEFLEREWRRAMREQLPLSLVMLDIDYFKLFNDNYGHLAGDECLKKVATVFAETLRRPADLAARYGGEEFILVLPDTGLRGALDIAERIRINVELLRVPHDHSSAARIVTVSIGVATQVPRQGTNSAGLLARVDAALYAAKHAGRNRVVAASNEDRDGQAEP